MRERVECRSGSSNTRRREGELLLTLGCGGSHCRLFSLLTLCMEDFLCGCAFVIKKASSCCIFHLPLYMLSISVVAADSLSLSLSSLFLSVDSSFPTDSLCSPKLLCACSWLLVWGTGVRGREVNKILRAVCGAGVCMRHGEGEKSKEKK